MRFLIVTTFAFALQVKIEITCLSKASVMNIISILLVVFWTPQVPATVWLRRAPTTNDNTFCHVDRLLSFGGGRSPTARNSGSAKKHSNSSTTSRAA